MQASHVVVFAGGVALGAVVGALTASVVNAPAPAVQAGARSHAGGGATADELADAIVRAFDRRGGTGTQPGSRRRSADAVPERREPAHTAAPSASPAPAPAPRPAASSAPRFGANDYAVDEPRQLHQKDFSLLATLVVRTEREEDRRRREWLFVSQEAVARVLGAPDDVDPKKDGSEAWSYDLTYRDADGENYEGSIDFYFVRGRVFSIGGAEAIPDED